MINTLTYVFGVTALLCFIAAAYLFNKNRRYKRKIGMYRSHETFQRGEIKVAEPWEFDPRFKTGKTGPTPETQIRFVAAYKVEGTIGDFETWFICNLAKTSQRIFEFGTCTGKTAYLLAANAQASAHITTLTLKPEQKTEYKPGTADEKRAERDALEESAFDEFFYAGTPEAEKIEQIFCDSKDFDETTYAAQYDLIFIDGSHAKSYVESDTAKALRMIKPGGIILWHDYRGPVRCPGVYETLNALGKRLPLVHIDGTCMVAYRHAG